MQKSTELVTALLHVFLLWGPHSGSSAQATWACVRREIIRYKLIPRAIAYYTGEAAEDEEGDDEDDYDDEDEDDEEARGPGALIQGLPAARVSIGCAG